MPKNNFLTKILPILFILTILTNVNAYFYPEALLTNGSFETNCGTGFPGTCNYNVDDDFQVVNDWNFIHAGGGSGDFGFDNNGATATDGNWSLRLLENATGGAGVANMTAKSTQTITGGKLLVNNIKMLDFDAGAGLANFNDVNFQILFYPSAGGSAVVLYNAQGEANILGTNVSANVPNYSGYPALRIVYLHQADRLISLYSDEFRWQQLTDLVLTVSEEADPFGIDVPFTLSTSVLELETNTELTGADCNVSWGGGAYVDMPFNSSTQKYEYTTTEPEPATKTYTISCGSSESNTKTASGSVEFIVPLTDYLQITDISNVSHNLNYSNVDFTPTTPANEFIFSAINSSGDTATVELNTINSLNDGRQYFIYKANPTQYNNGTWVFDDTATFGSTNSNPIQKIWDENSNHYVYTQDVGIPIGLTYYKFTYKSPAKYFQKIKGEVDWSNTLEPSESIELGLAHDLFAISSFSNIRSTYIPFIPDISGDETSAYELQITAWSDVDANLSVGQTTTSGDTVQTVALTTTPHRYSFTLNASNTASRAIITSTFISAPADIHVQDYAILARGYFTKRLELFKQNSDFLDLILYNGESTQYLREGKPFRVATEAYDKDGDLEELQIEAYFDQTGDDINKSSHKEIPLISSSEKVFSINETVEGIVDLSGNATTPLRDVLVKATLVNADGDEIAVQSFGVKFIQFPYFNNDIQILFSPTEKRKGKNPKGIITLNTVAPETLLGYDIRIWDANGIITIPAYQTKIFKGTDFECVFQNCSVEFKVNDYLFETAGQTWIAVSAILNTETFSLTNPLTQSLRSINTAQIDFTTAKIHQINERADRKYKSTEEIPLVLLLQSTEYTDLSKDIDVYMTLANCDDTTPANGNCDEQSTVFMPTGIVFDDKTNTNYYFFRNLWYLDDSSLPVDGNFLAFRAHVSDKTGITQSITPVLADKCATNGTDFFTNMLAGLLNGLGCTAPQSNIVSLSTNSANERAVEIADDRNTTAPSQELFACVGTDTNNVIGDPLTTDFYCFTWYQVAEKPIDNFRLRITNQYSDVSDEGATKQYVEFNIPYEIVALNDVSLLKAELETNQQTSINTVGEFIQAGLGSIARGGIKNLGIENIVNGSNVISNIGADMNLNQAFDPATVSGMMFYVIKGMPIINAQDYRYDSRVEDDFDNINRKQFLNYLAENDVSYRTSPAKLDLVVDSFAVKQSFTDPSGHLLIDEEPSNQPINSQNTDVNSRQPYQYVPATLAFTLQNAMIFENFSLSDIRSLILTIKTPIETSILTQFNSFVSDLTSDPVDAIINVIFKNILLITIILMIAIIYTYIARKRGG